MDFLSNDFDLDGALAKDTSGAVLKEVREALQNNQNELRRKMDRGLTTEEFKQADALRKACEAASSIVEESWRGFHQR